MKMNHKHTYSATMKNQAETCFFFFSSSFVSSMNWQIKQIKCTNDAGFPGIVQSKKFNDRGRFYFEEGVSYVSKGMFDKRFCQTVCRPFSFISLKSGWWIVLHGFETRISKNRARHLGTFHKKGHLTNMRKRAIKNTKEWFLKTERKKNKLMLNFF